ncbi:MAG TPA: macro domain-containing protein [Acidimicrobiales bacterium]|nr:macro domain-containing protein [Acidimicrobiales bacterium]
MQLDVVRGDITRESVDAIVNAANRQLAPGGGVCGAIHRAAGRRLAEACARLAPCDTGDAVATRAFDLEPGIRWVIHAVGPVWHGGHDGEAELLASCYRRILEVADEVGARTVSVPAISTGIYGYPLREASDVAVDALLAVADGPGTDVEEVHLVAFDEDTHRVLEEAVSARRR